MSIFISGSVAYDTILNFGGQFADHLLQDGLDRINLTFQTPRMAKNYGGCAANIAYSLKVCGGEPLIVTTVGKDASEYLEHLKTLGIRYRAGLHHNRRVRQSDNGLSRRGDGFSQ